MLMEEVKSTSGKGESPKEKSPDHKEPALKCSFKELSSSVQVVAAATAPSNTLSAHTRQSYPYCALPSSGASSESELNEEGPCCGDRDQGLFLFPMLKVGPRPPARRVRRRGHLMTSTSPLTAIMQPGPPGHRR